METTEEKLNTLNLQLLRHEAKALAVFTRGPRAGERVVLRYLTCPMSAIGVKLVPSAPGASPDTGYYNFHRLHEGGGDEPYILEYLWWRAWPDCLGSGKSSLFHFDGGRDQLGEAEKCGTCNGTGEGPGRVK